MEEERLRCGSRGEVADEDEDDEEYLDSLFVIDGKRTLFWLPPPPLEAIADFPGVVRGCGLVRNGKSSSSSSSSEFA